MAPNGEQHTEGPYESQVYAGEQTQNIEESARHDPDFQTQWNRSEVQAYIASQQSAELSGDVRMGDDRAITDTPNWMGYSSQQLFDSATMQNTPTTADTLGQAFNTGGNDLADAANRLLSAVSKLDNAWTGVAADSAKGALTPLASAAGSAGTSAQLMSAQMSQQSAAAAEVRKLPSPQEFNVDQALNAALTGGLPALQADLKAQKDAADAVKREQVSYLTAYTATLAAVDAQTPSFIAPPPTVGGGGNDGSSIGGERVGSPNIGTMYSGPGGGTSHGGPSGGHTGIAPGGENGQGYTPGDGDGDDYTSIPGVTPGSGTNASGWNPTTSTGPSPNLPGPTTGAPSGGPSAGAGGFGGGFGNFGSGAGGAGGANAIPKGGLPAGGSGPPAAAPRGGMMPAGMGGGRGGGPMGGAAGGRRGEGEEDDEHQRPSYLVEGDPDSAFGNDQMTAPSVIGDEED